MLSVNSAAFSLLLYSPCRAVN